MLMLRERSYRLTAPYCTTSARIPCPTVFRPRGQFCYKGVWIFGQIL